MAPCSYGLCSYGLYSYGPYSYGLCTYGLWHRLDAGTLSAFRFRPKEMKSVQQTKMQKVECGLHSYGLYSYGLCSYGLYSWPL